MLYEVNYILGVTLNGQTHFTIASPYRLAIEYPHRADPWPDYDYYYLCSKSVEKEKTNFNNLLDISRDYYNNRTSATPLQFSMLLPAINGEKPVRQHERIKESCYFSLKLISAEDDYVKSRG